jgi:hypothetical protein
LFGFAAPYNWNSFLAIFCKLYPEKHFIDDIPDLGQDMSTIPNQRAEETLEEMGLSRWTSLEESVRANTEDLALKKTDKWSSTLLPERIRTWIQTREFR